MHCFIFQSHEARSKLHSVASIHASEKLTVFLGIKRKGGAPAGDIMSLFPAGDPKTWQNKSLPGDPNYLVGANCVSVLIDHF